MKEGNKVMVTIYYGSSGSGKSYMLRKNKPGKRPLVYTDNKEKQREWNEKDIGLSF